MSNARKLTWGLIAMGFTVALAGCGSDPSAALDASNSPMSLGSSFGASDAQVGADTNIMELNSSGQLDSLTDSDLAGLDNPTDDSAAPVSATDPTVQDLIAPNPQNPPSPSAQTMTKVGIVRSDSSGHFYLQINKGFLFWNTQTSLPLQGADSTSGLRIASDLNCKVVLRGLNQGNSCLVRLIYKVPDFAVIWQMFTEGHVAGKAYAGSTMAGVPDAQITVTSDANRQIWRATAGTDGSYSIGLLNPGTYEVAASAPGYLPTRNYKITVAKMHTSTVNLDLNQAGGQLPILKN
ncbi:MAG: carboxypeptidase regulatory-like domain-containing protein [Cyanobacteria bacterium REEB65]|nr:carboxypeptidase regulatory-like domain-containing protein [Cyanobacteria bacterium REEB65]